MLSCTRMFYQETSKLWLMEHRNSRTTRYLILNIKVLCVFCFNICTFMVYHAFQKINRCYFYSNSPRARVRKQTSTTDDQRRTMARSPPPPRQKSEIARLLYYEFLFRSRRPLSKTHRHLRILATPGVRDREWVHERRRRAPACGIGSSVAGTHVPYDNFLTGLTYV